MGKLSDNKLTKLNNLDNQGGFWYITKQNLNFRDLCYMAKILESWNDRKEENYETFFNSHKTLPEYGRLSDDLAHRATKNCEYIGLTKPSDKYKAQNLTPFYFSLKKLCDGDFDRLSIDYSKIVNKQLERIFINSQKISPYNVNIKICPFMFLFKILLLIGDITKAYKISTTEFKLFVATAQEWNEYFEVVESIIRYRNDQEFRKQCDKNLGKVSDVRYNILAQNHSQLDVTSSDISILDGEIKNVRKKVAEYELDDKIQTEEDVFSADIVLERYKQTIIYGSPGSGKSHKVKDIVEAVYPDKDERDKYVFRTTFHPDSDYASFVGCYKPIMDGEKIKYEFSPQAFTKAYVAAWNNSKKPVYLIIEEINRGNCAQIFGDLFQLLDRKDDISEYPINADEDLKNHLEKALNADGKEGIANDKLKLPANLNIIATMNTSDQSLFPMDSAFKRRWSWECVPIDYNNDKSKSYTITIAGKQHNWIVFLVAVNAMIYKVTQSEDKKMGNFFITGDINERQFIDKVMFYLWNDICKEEVGTQNNFFRNYVGDKKAANNTKEFSFDDLFQENGRNLLIGFMEYIKNEYANSIKTIDNDTAVDEEENETDSE